MSFHSGHIWQVHNLVWWTGSILLLIIPHPCLINHHCLARWVKIFHGNWLLPLQYQRTIVRSSVWEGTIIIKRTRSYFLEFSHTPRVQLITDTKILWKGSAQYTEAWSSVCNRISSTVNMISTIKWSKSCSTLQSDQMCLRCSSCAYTLAWTSTNYMNIYIWYIIRCLKARQLKWCIHKIKIKCYANLMPYSDFRNKYFLLWHRWMNFHYIYHFPVSGV